MDIIKKIAEELGLRQDRAEAVVELMDEGNTVPFIARYRKERTGGMDDETLRAFDERLKYLRNLEDRKATVLASIEEQGKLTDELRKEIDDAETAARVEDLYRPYKPKRRTRATIAKERGLEPLADLIRDRRAKTDPAEAAESSALESDLRDVLSTLTDRERRVIELRYGLLDGRTRTLEEVGAEFHVTRERIRQIEAKALRKLRHPSRSRRLADYAR